MSREYFDRAMIPGTRDEQTQIVRHYICTGPCNQGRSACPTPEACEVSEDDADPVASAVFWRLYAVAVLLVALMAVLVISAS